MNNNTECLLISIKLAKCAKKWKTKYEESQAELQKLRKFQAQLEAQSEAKYKAKFVIDMKRVLTELDKHVKAVGELRIIRAKQKAQQIIDSVDEKHTNSSILNL